MRKLDLFFEIEEKIMSKQTLDKSLMQVKKKIEKESNFDHVYYLKTHSKTFVHTNFSVAKATLEIALSIC